MPTERAIAITGANGHLGRQLLAALMPTRRVVAIVRSARAAGALPEHPNLQVRVLDYTQAHALRDALHDCAVVVHLVGIIKESRANPFVMAHEATCRALASGAAAAGVTHVIYPSIVGADQRSTNACLRSKAVAEAALLASEVPALVLRLPMVLGEGDYASAALARRARKRVAVGLRMRSLEQPIYAGDVVRALLAGIALAEPSHTVLELAGPESLTRAELTRRAARVLGVSPPTIVSLPLVLGTAAAFVLEHTASEPPVTRAMLGVLDHDDAIDPAPACARLGITLTPLDDALQAVLGNAPNV